MLPRIVRSDESGLALVAVLLVMVLLTGIGAGLTAVGLVEFQTSVNHRSATRALLLADAGATHAQALLRGWVNSYSYNDVLVGANGVGGDDDDGLLVGYSGLPPRDAIADTGVLLAEGRYFVSMENDPADPSGNPYVDSNDRIMAICRGETRDGGRAEVRVIFASPDFPAIVSNGDLAVPGDPAILGPCGGVHANHKLNVSGTPTVNGGVSASDTVIVSGTIRDEYGNEVTPEYQPPIEVPDYDPLDYCDEADYVLRNGFLITVAPPRDSTFTGGIKRLGWQWEASTDNYTLTGKDAVPGTVCAFGNLEVNGSLGGVGDTLAITLLATGSVKISGNPVIEPDHSEGVLIIAGGDLEVGGNPAGLTPYYSGTLYGHSQCQVNGTSLIAGHVLCYDAPNPPGSRNDLNENKINGTPNFAYDCSGVNQLTLVSSWWENRAQ